MNRTFHEIKGLKMCEQMEISFPLKGPWLVVSQFTPLSDDISFNEAKFIDGVKVVDSLDLQLGQLAYQNNNGKAECVAIYVDSSGWG